MFVEDAGDTLHTQRNALDSRLSVSMYGRTILIRRTNRSASWRRAATHRQRLTPDCSVTTGFKNEGDNEITGIHVSDGNSSPKKTPLCTKSPSPFTDIWRVFYTQQHGDNVTYEVIRNQGTQAAIRTTTVTPDNQARAGIQPALFTSSRHAGPTTRGLLGMQPMRIPESTGNNDVLFLLTATRVFSTRYFRVVEHRKEVYRRIGNPFNPICATHHPCSGARDRNQSPCRVLRLRVDQTTPAERGWRVD